MFNVNSRSCPLELLTPKRGSFKTFKIYHRIYQFNRLFVVTSYCTDFTQNVSFQTIYKFSLCITLDLLISYVLLYAQSHKNFISTKYDRTSAHQLCLNLVSKNYVFIVCVGFLKTTRNRNVLKKMSNNSTCFRNFVEDIQNNLSKRKYVLKFCHK